jgi:hypothetical protein
MNMIGHEHICMQFTFMPIATRSQQVQVQAIIGIGKETCLAIIATLDDVLGNSWQIEPSRTWHDGASN